MSTHVRFALLCLFLALTPARAERHAMAELRFVPAGGTSALFDGIVASLAQDERGLLWVGSSVGLMRYDGYQIRAFPMTGANAGGERGNGILRALMADGNMLWASGDGEGLARFDTHGERWTFYRHDPTRPESIAPGAVFRLARAHDGRIWLGMLGSLDCLDPASGRFEHHRAADGTGLPDDRIGALLVDRRGDVWVGTWRGLVRRGAAGGRFEVVGGALLEGAVVQALAEGPDGRIWAGTRDGRLLAVEPADGAARLLEAGDAGVGTSPVLSLLNVSGSEVWVGRAGGIEVRDADGRLQQTLKHNQRRPGSLAGTYFNALLQDSAGMVWVGSYGGGLQRHNPVHNGLWVRRQDDNPSSPLADTDVRSVLQLDSGEVWLGTPERGIAVVDAGLRTIATIPPDGRFGGQVAAAGADVRRQRMGRQHPRPAVPLRSPAPAARDLPHRSGGRAPAAGRA
jgi:ligand-binding sensor domain-containing protein